MNKGPFCKIEQSVCGIFDKEFGLFTRNGTTAIWLALESLGCKRRKIVVPANICFVVVCAIMLSGNEPYFVDIDDNFSIDPGKIKNINSKDVSGIIFPYMYGNAGNIKEVIKIAKSKNWFVIEDVAQALGAKIGDKFAGSFADFSIVSFGMGKIIDVNMGGVLCLKSRKLYEKAKRIYNKLPVLNDDFLSAYERFNKLYNVFIDFIERGDEQYKFGKPLTETYKNANINKLGFDRDFIKMLEVKINNLDEELKIRQGNACAFQSILKHHHIKTIKHNKGSTYWRQNILVDKERDGLLKFLKSNGVKASKYFPAIDKLFYRRNDENFKRCDLMASRVINLWPGRETTFSDIARINELINKFYKQHSI
ncbi:MAG: DegT/DnrJ/EryC1/StrS family aminotransferase [Candidatus Omnitrophica bacterium]|nr:DegT/DnrJ/EryC1/StrS family aminotransferase [Candidatus Omnitrophota bacterium]